MYTKTKITEYITLNYAISKLNYQRNVEYIIALKIIKFIYGGTNENG